MKLRIRHLTRYTYAPQAFESAMELRLTPRPEAQLAVRAHRIETSPRAPLSPWNDPDGNVVHTGTWPYRVESIAVTNFLEVETGLGSRPAPRALTQSDCWMHGYLPLPTAPAPSEALADWARVNAMLPASVKRSGTALAERMHAAFEYRSGSTEYSTPLEEVLAQKAGVCQDFARLFVAACRFHGVPARYLSGYLLPQRDPDENATHAWAEAWDPEKGWLSFDPTNPGTPRERYVPLAAAAEPTGAAPARGIFRGPSKEKLEVEVKVELV